MKSTLGIGLTRRTLVEIGIAVVLYFAGLFLCVWFVENHQGSRWVVPVALIPMMGIALALFSAMRHVRGMDELHQKMHLEALAFAFLAQWFILIAYGFLRLAGITLFEAHLLGPIMILLWCAGLAIAAWRYR